METKQAKITPQFGQYGSVEKLYVDKEQIARPWGIETADTISFFSLETGGWHTQVLQKSRPINKTNQHKTLFTVQMKEGSWQGDINEFIENDSLIRQFDYRALTNCWAMDIVMRFAFKKEVVQFAKVGGQHIEWDGADFYHQFQTDHVDLQLKNCVIRIAAQNLQFSPKWKPVMYVRCSPSEKAWIVHLRLLPIIGDKEIFKIRLIGNKHTHAPKFITRLIVSLPKVANHLRYAGEFKRANFGRLNIYPLVKIHKDEKFHLEANIFLL